MLFLYASSPDVIMCLPNKLTTVPFHQATTTIDDPEFVRIWHLLDIISVFSDNGSFPDRPIVRPHHALTPFRAMRAWPHLLVD